MQYLQLWEVKCFLLVVFVIFRVVIDFNVSWTFYHQIAANKMGLNPFVVFDLYFYNKLMFVVSVARQGDYGDQRTHLI